MPEKCILLEDAVAQRQTSHKSWNPLATKSVVGERLLRGSLLVELTDVEARETQLYFTPSLNYKKFSDDSLKLYCKLEQVLQLSDEQFSLLLGVKLPFDRYKVLNILPWVEKLKAGFCVNVTIPTIPQPVRGIVRYIGSLPGEEGTKFGIELLERRGQGANDGTFKNIYYFKCDRDCAMFVAMDKLSEPETSKSSQVQETVQPHPSQIQDAPLKLGDKVIFYDENDKPVNGFVRWIGRNKDAFPNGTKIVGIETNQQILPQLIPGSLRGMNDFFRLHNTKGVQLFLPINSVRKVDDNPYNLDEGSCVQFRYNDRPCYGVLIWIGVLPQTNDVTVAGVEMDESIKGTSDGVYQGVKYFTSQPGKGIFLPLARLKPDARFCTENNNADDEPSLPEIAQLRKDLKTLEAQINGGIRDGVNSTVTQLDQNFSEIEKKFESLQTQTSYYQQKTEESIQRMVINVDNAFRKALEVQKSNEELQKSNELLQKSNAHLRNQLSLTQQQLLGVQSMMVCSRLWVVSHDQFTIGREIGRGAWATVHETTFRGAAVAAKRLHHIITAPRTRQLFQREMEMVLQCQHQNIVTFLGATLEGPPVILMEMMDTNLRSAYEQGNIKDHEVLGILYDIASALHFLHTRPDPVIHRDVSSANVLLKALYSGEWLAKLGDLGTAKLQQQAATTYPGAMAYGAPEAGDYTKHSPKMDVYSYGILILETLTATHPFEVVDVLKAQVQQQFPQYHQLVTSCTNHQSNDRPTMYDVIGQLDKIKPAMP